MAQPESKPLLTVNQYLNLERKSHERHFFLDGEIFAMAGETGEHGDISVNAVGILYNQLKCKPCRVRTKDTKVRSGQTPMLGHSTRGFISYPDIVVVCAEPEYHDAYTDIILNPTAILEILSPSTEAFDRGEKFDRYQSCNPSLCDYLLISQDQPRIEQFTRQSDGKWTYQRHVGLDAVVTIASIGCTLKLADVYDRVVFAAK